MSKEEIGLRLQNLDLTDQLAALTAKLAELEAACRYGEQCDDMAGFTDENVPPRTFPRRALLYQKQRIGLLCRE